MLLISFAKWKQTIVRNTAYLCYQFRLSGRNFAGVHHTSLLTSMKYVVQMFPEEKLKLFYLRNLIVDHGSEKEGDDGEDYHLDSACQRQPYRESEIVTNRDASMGRVQNDDFW
jgi:hypothetical protein